MIKEMQAFDSEEELVKSSKIELTSDFYSMTYDEPFKNVFSIKRILAVIIKETIDLYQSCTIDEIVGLIGSISPIADTGLNYDNDRIIVGESYVRGEGTIKYDLLLKAGVPSGYIENALCKYVQIKLNLEMQRDSTPGYPLTFRGLYYGSRLISDQIPKLTKSSDYKNLVPVYSIWITLVEENTDAVNKVLSYKLKNTSCNCTKDSNSFIGRMDKVTDLLNIYLICIDKRILADKSVVDNLDPVVEFVSLLFAGQFDDDRMKNHDIGFESVITNHGKELKEMANYYSEIEEIVAKEVDKAEARGEARGKAEGEAEGEARGIIKMALKFGKDRGFVIESLTKELNISISKAEEYYEIFSNKQSF